jgi:pSer/pThr/pTyr-binding forkhead associated (FHA) protein
MHSRDTLVTPKLVLSTATRLIRRIAVDRPRLTIGRRPNNDVMLDDLTVSGEHAVLHTAAGETVIHDLNSRNGTLVNGVPVLQQVLVEGDRVEVGIYRLHYVLERAADPTPAGAGAAGDTGLAATPATARVRVLSGPHAGTVLRIDRPIVSITNATGHVAVIARRRNGFHVTHLEGTSYPLVNGESIGLVAHPLSNDDLIELAGTIFQFQAEPP